MSTSGNTRGWILIMIGGLLFTSLGTAAARKYRHHYLHRPDRTHVYDPDRRQLKPRLSEVKSSWPYVEQVIEYPGASGTTVLDAFSRRPVITTTDCRYVGEQPAQGRMIWANQALE